jgi:Peptidase family C25/FlgD Ig-like domain
MLIPERFFRHNLIYVTCFLYTFSLFGQSRNKNTSILADGDVYKIAITNAGIQKLDYEFLKTALKIDIDKINPQNIKIFGNGGGILPEANAAPRPDDVTENAIQIVGEEDGKFDKTDFILFYAEAADVWRYDGTENTFARTKNPYETRSYYFLKIAKDAGLRIANVAPLTISPTYISTTYDAFGVFEEDKLNLLDRNRPTTQGSGRLWLGDGFSTTSNTRTYTGKFSFPNHLATEPLKIRARMAARSSENTRFIFNIDGKDLTSNALAGINLAGSLGVETYAQLAETIGAVTVATENPTLKVTFSAGSGEGWMDFLEMQTRSALKMSGTQLAFRDTKTLDYAASDFKMENVKDGIAIWNLKNPLKPEKPTVKINSGIANFSALTKNYLQQFIAFYPNEITEKPTAIGKIDNQNLHALNDIDLVILYPPALQASAERLAAHRKAFSRLNVAMVQPEQVFNEFASGALDPTSIRDFAKMLFHRSKRFKYLLLLGDGSFDYKNIKKIATTYNHIPVYETEESLEPLIAFPSDDYYAILEDGEGENLQGTLDIAIGRIPAQTSADADAVVNKIIRYDKNPATLGEWRLRSVFVADDEDYNIHIDQADDLAQFIDKQHIVYNPNKVYFDAFPQEASSGGTRIPGAEEALDQNIFKGALFINYLGHGSARRWGQESVLTKNRIDTWNNPDKLPLCITATCSFSGYDDPEETVAGEKMILRKNGGAIALFSTVREVYSDRNKELNDGVFEFLFEKQNGQRPALGEILRLAKNSRPGRGFTENSRKFTLLGDPSLQLALPQYDIATLKINGQAANSTTRRDTIRAFQSVTIEGEVRDANGATLSSFNGTIFPTVFDKKVVQRTLAQDAESQVKDFTLQKNVLFKGKSSVKNGKFTFNFVVPKDINYNFGFGKISYYASDSASMTDAAGYYNKITVGGTFKNSLENDQKPQIQGFLNNENFKNGGTTDTRPTLLLRLADDYGINIAGNSIGHDLTAVLDGDAKNTIVLNDFYEADRTDNRKGTVKYPFSQLSAGKHELRIKVWDIANQSSEITLSFIVNTTVTTTLDKAIALPNPFATVTNFSFTHALTAQSLKVTIHIFNITGELVKIISQEVYSNGDTVTGLQWDGLSDGGDKLPRGIYIYQIKTQATNDAKQNAQSGFEKLVLLK